MFYSKKKNYLNEPIDNKKKKIAGFLRQYQDPESRTSSFTEPNPICQICRQPDSVQWLLTGFHRRSKFATKLDVID